MIYTFMTQIQYYQQYVLLLNEKWMIQLGHNFTHAMHKIVTRKVHKSRNKSKENFHMILNLSS